MNSKTSQLIHQLRKDADSASQQESSARFTEVESSAPNALRDRQLRFQPKAKRPRHKDALAKPTVDEAANIRQDWAKRTVQFCVACFKTEDTAGRSNIDWVSCNECDSWLHLSCCGTDHNDLICTSCSGVINI